MSAALLQVKPEAKTEAKGAAKPPGKTVGASIGAPPSVQEILEALIAWGPVTSKELTIRFKGRLSGPEDKKTFTNNVKKVSRLEEQPPGSGKKFIVLK